MKSKRSRLDRYLSQQLKIKRSDVRLLLAQKRVSLDGVVATDINQRVDQFTTVDFDGRCLQANTPSYIMLNKPTGVVSATCDDKHTTVIDLLDGECFADKENLHIAGRLDFNSTGLLLLTNDGRWSRALSGAETAVTKRYRVTLTTPVTDAMVQAFAEGMYFEYEDITTRPAELIVLGACAAEVVLTDGRYHQIKRMFGHFQSKVLTLHRFAVGGLLLDDGLDFGCARHLSEEEQRGINSCSRND